MLPQVDSFQYNQKQSRLFWEHTWVNRGKESSLLKLNIGTDLFYYYFFFFSNTVLATWEERVAFGKKGGISDNIFSIL